MRPGNRRRLSPWLRCVASWSEQTERPADQVKTARRRASRRRRPPRSVPCTPPHVEHQNAPRVRRVELSFLHWNRSSRGSPLCVTFIPIALGGVPLFHVPGQITGPRVGEHSYRVAVGRCLPEAQLHWMDAEGPQHPGHAGLGDRAPTRLVGPGAVFEAYQPVDQVRGPEGLFGEDVTDILQQADRAPTTCRASSAPPLRRSPRPLPRVLRAGRQIT